MYTFQWFCLPLNLEITDTFEWNEVLSDSNLNTNESPSPNDHWDSQGNSKVNLY